MRRSTSYNTKQREVIVAYLASLKGAHVTAAQIAEHFKDERISAGLTTIYRHLDKLVQEGIIQKYMLDGITGACYQYVENDISNSSDHYHLKCDSCGKLIHLQCDYVEDLRKHFFEDHTFALDPVKTVFYGKCSQCYLK